MSEQSQLNKSVEALVKKFGEGSVTILGKDPEVKVEVISTGSIGLDKALGVGGLPRGRVVEVFGAEASGKTTLALKMIANAQKMDLTCAYIDAEHALDIDYAKRIGVDFERLPIAQPDCGEEALIMADTFIRESGVKLVIVDSVASLVPRAELEGDIDKNSIALQARLMAKALRKLLHTTKKNSAIVFFINQLRANINRMGLPQSTTPGGRSLKYYASVRLELHSEGKIKKGEVVIGNKIMAKVVKSRVGHPFKSAEFDIFYEEGISKSAEIVRLGLELGLISKQSLTFYYGSTKLGAGADVARVYLKEHPELASEIEAEIIKKLG